MLTLKKYLEQKSRTDPNFTIKETESGLAILKHCAAPETKIENIDTEERTVTAIISTDSVDRDGEILLPKGIILEHFEKNPVIPWSHNTLQPPIGKALWVKKGRNKITAKVLFAKGDEGAPMLADQIWPLFRDKFLQAFSVGFIPLDGRQPTPDDIRKNPDWAEAWFVFTKWELLEFSPVTVPSNRDALATAVKSKSLVLNSELIKQFDIENDIVSEDVVIEKELVKFERADVVITPDVDITEETKKAMHEALEKHKGVVYAE